MTKTVKNIFVEGPIPPKKVAQSIASHQSKHEIGAHQLFLGQIRKDEVDNSIVEAIEYSAQTEMANQVAHEIREEAFAKFDVTCLHIYHSLGTIKVGEIGFMVFTSSPHRAACRDACSFIVEQFKKHVPIYGKTLYENGKHGWKENTES